MVRRVSETAALAALLDDLDAHLGRHAAGVIARHGEARADACRRILQEIYLRVFAPVRALLPPANGAPRPLVVVPHGLLHRVPFHALHDGQNYLLSDWVITIAPSLAAAHLGSPPSAGGGAVVVGVCDMTTPLIEDEARAVAKVVAAGSGGRGRSSGDEWPRLLLGAEATLAVVREAIDGAALVHLACHGLFRFGNPAFSSLRLADRWARAADLVDVSLDGATLVLSACETARVNPEDGHEATGLAAASWRPGPAASWSANGWPTIGAPPN